MVWSSRWSHQVTHAVPLRGGFELPYAVRSLELGGKDLSEFLAKELGLTRAGDIAEHIKMAKCYVALRGVGNTGDRTARLARNTRRPVAKAGLGTSAHNGAPVHALSEWTRGPGGRHWHPPANQACGS